MFNSSNEIFLCVHSVLLLLSAFRLNTHFLMRTETTEQRSVLDYLEPCKKLVEKLFQFFSLRLNVSPQD